VRKVTFGVANSLDNFIARQDHGVDWLLWTKEVAAVTTKFWKTIDTVVMGRKTYEVALKSGTSSYPGVKNLVFSRTLKKSPDKSVEIISEDAARFIRSLKKQKGKGICVMGGGELAQSLFEANLIDEVGLNIHPVLLGSGIPLFLSMKRQLDLELLECRTLEKPTLNLTSFTPLYQIGAAWQRRSPKCWVNEGNKFHSRVEQVRFGAVECTRFAGTTRTNIPGARR
jgi:dihydrofolate reductase